MPTIYTKETALYDPGKIRDDIEHAAETASSYIAEISGANGIFVHPGNTPDDPEDSDACGVQITDEINIVRGGVSVAEFGADGAQIGKADENHIVVDSDEVSFCDDTNQLCSFRASSEYAENITEIQVANGRSLLINTLDQDSVMFGEIYMTNRHGTFYTGAQNSNQKAKIDLDVQQNYTMITLDADRVYLCGHRIVDFVGLRGTSGAWKYEKWISGKVEAWGTILFSTLTFSAGGALYKSVDNAFSIPSGIFDSTPTHGDAFIMGANMDYMCATVGSLSTTGGNCEVWKATSGNGSNVYVHIHLTYIP